MRARLLGATAALTAIAALGIGSMAAWSSETGAGMPLGSYCPARGSQALVGTQLPVGCPPRRGQPLSQALSFGAAICATGWWAQRPRR